MLHSIVTNDWFMLITGSSGIIGLIVSCFIATKVYNISNNDLNKITSQNQKINGKNNIQSGRDSNVN